MGSHGLLWHGLQASDYINREGNNVTIYHTKVVNIGSQANLFKEENMMILFGTAAPADLADYCFNIELTTVNGTIATGDTLSFDHQDYKVTAVGNVVLKNLKDLGHITIKFDGSSNPTLGGTLHVEDKAFPDITVGTEITIV